MTPEIVYYQPGDEKDILELFHRTFGAEISLEHWQWENKDNPYGESVITLLKSGDKILGHLCMQPCLMKIKDEFVMAGRRIYAVLDEEYRQRGYYAEMLDHLHEEGGKRGISFSFSFPNQQALEALAKSPSVEVAVPHHFVKVYRGYRTASMLTGNILLRLISGTFLELLLSLRWPKRAKTHMVKELESFDTRFDRLWERVSPALGAAAVRDSKYLNWRYTDAPVSYRVFAYEEGDEVRGYIVLCSIAERGYIADILVEEPGKVIPPLLKKADRVMKEEGCALLSFWCLGEGKVGELLKKRGFWPLGSNIRFTLLNIPPHLEEYLQQESSWYLTPGDSNYV